jgi:hypothetical protein
MFYLTSVATIRQLLEELLKEIKVLKGQRKGVKRVRNDETKGIISTEFQRVIYISALVIS